MTSTSIEWTDRVWNPVRGCSVVSPGCHNCYAMKQAHRFNAPGRPYEGLTKQTTAGPQWTGVIRLVEEALLKPLGWRKPQRVFVNSMSDLFHESVPGEFIDAVFAVMALSPRHTYQILTKRPERMRDYFARINTFGQTRRSAVVGLAWQMLGAPSLRRYAHEGIQSRPWPLPNVWLGVSVEDQTRAEQRIPLLMATPAAVRFVSAEPLIGPVRLGHHHLGGLDWLIVGGESGHGARPCRVQWIRDLVAQCRTAGVVAFVKQLGANIEGDPRPPERRDPVTGARILSVRQVVEIHDRKGGDPSEWPEDLRVREWPR